MRQLNIYLVTGSKAANVAGSTIFRDNILRSLESAGHNVVVYNFEEHAAAAGITDSAKVKDLCTEGILRAFSTAHKRRAFDLAFCLLNNIVIHPPALQQLADQVLTVNYTTNYHQFHLVEEIAKHVTLSTYISLPAKSAFDAMGVRSFWMPMAASPELYRPSARKERFAAFVGTAYGERPYYVWRLLQRGTDINVYGPAWQRRGPFGRFLRNFGEPILYILGNTEQRLRFIGRNERRLIIERVNEAYPDRIHGTLSDSDMLKTLATSHAVINLAESRFNHDYLNPRVLRGCNFRDFEVPMAGSCLFTQHSLEIEHFYEPGTEAVIFHDDVELADQLAFYQRDLSALEKIAAAGHRRALQEHTWEKRFQKLFEHLDLS